MHPNVRPTTSTKAGPKQLPPQQSKTTIADGTTMPSDSALLTTRRRTDVDSRMQQPDAGGGGGGLPHHSAPLTLPVPMAGVDTVETLRAHNIAQRIQLSTLERELAHCRHSLNLTVTKGPTWVAGRHRVTLCKALPVSPAEQWTFRAVALKQAQQRALSGSPQNLLAAAGALDPAAAVDVNDDNGDDADRQLLTRTLQHSLEQDVLHLVQTLQHQLEERGRRVLELETENGNLVRQLDEAKASRKVSIVEPLATAATASGGIVAGGQTTSSSSSLQTAAVIAHLNAQLTFLQGEVDRLEQTLQHERTDAAQTHSQAGVVFAREVRSRDEKNNALMREITTLKQHLRAARGGGGTGGIPIGFGSSGDVDADLFGSSPQLGIERLHALEKELTAVSIEKTNILTEKNALQTRSWKLDERCKELQTAVTEATAKQQATEEKWKAAWQSMLSVSQERDQLKANAEWAEKMRRLQQSQLVHTATATDAPAETMDRWVQKSDEEEAVRRANKRDVQCQVGPASAFIAGGGNDGGGAYDSSTSGSAESSTNQPKGGAWTVAGPGHHNMATSSAAALSHALEQKSMELDGCRAALGDLQAQHHQATSSLTQYRQALNEETQKCVALVEELDKTTLQLRTMQQQCSHLQIMLKDRDAGMSAADARTQQAVNTAIKCEAEQRSFEQQLVANAEDMRRLVQQQQTAAQHLAQAVAESDGLRAELVEQHRLQAQLQYALKAKDVELQEILTAYQLCVQEHESVVARCKMLEREYENVRAMLSVKEERDMASNQQIQSLHAREQQLTMDLQACDYENSVLHRKLLQLEQQSHMFNAQLYDAKAGGDATAKVADELQRTQVELHKQLVLKDNELMFLRQRCDDAEQDLGTLTARSTMDRHRARELEELNARMTVTGIVKDMSAAQQNLHTAANTASDAARQQRLEDECSALRDKSAELAVALSKANTACAAASTEAAALRDTLSQERTQFDALKRSFDQIKAALLQQQAAFSALGVSTTTAASGAGGA